MLDNLVKEVFPIHDEAAFLFLALGVGAVGAAFSIYLWVKISRLDLHQKTS